MSHGLSFYERLMLGMRGVATFGDLGPCHSFGVSKFVDQKYSESELEPGFPNPWHLGTFADVPQPEIAIQGEVELCMLMFSMVLSVKPRLVFESGTNFGAMARALGFGCWVNGFGRVVTADVDHEMVEYARKLCNKLPVEVRHGPALDQPELREADLVFIDSSYESRTLERKSVKSGSIFVYHDSCAEPWIRPELDRERFVVHVDGPRGFSIGRRS